MRREQIDERQRRDNTKVNSRSRSLGSVEAEKAERGKPSDDVKCAEVGKPSGISVEGAARPLRDGLKDVRRAKGHCEPNEKLPTLRP